MQLARQVFAELEITENMASDDTHQYHNNLSVPSLNTDKLCVNMFL
jgi:hypothetical protein